MSESEHEGILLEFESPCGRFSLVFEDDGKVAYGYVTDEDRITGDVWLYNRRRTPEQPEWHDKDNLPFANPKGYVSAQGTVVRRVLEADVAVTWKYEEDKPVAHIYLFEELCGIVGPNDRPGYARFAIKDGPLARVLPGRH